MEAKKKTNTEKGKNSLKKKPETEEIRDWEKEEKAGLPDVDFKRLLGCGG